MKLRSIIHFIFITSSWYCLSFKLLPKKATFTSEVATQINAEYNAHEIDTANEAVNRMRRINITDLKSIFEDSLISIPNADLVIPSIADWVDVTLNTIEMPEWKINNVTLLLVREIGTSLLLDCSGAQVVFMTTLR